MMIMISTINIDLLLASKILMLAGLLIKFAINLLLLLTCNHFAYSNANYVTKLSLRYIYAGNHFL